MPDPNNVLRPNFGNQGTAHSATSKTTILRGGGGGGGGGMSGSTGGDGGSNERPVTHNDLQLAIAGIRAEIRGDLLLHWLALLGTLLVIYFGVVASNQAAGTLGFSVSEAARLSAESAAESAAQKAREQMIEELDRRDAEKQQSRR